MAFEPQIDENWPISQFLLIVFSTPFRLDKNSLDWYSSVC